MTSEQFNLLNNLKDPTRVFIEIRTVEDDPNCLRIITTGNLSPYTERLVDCITHYKEKTGEYPSLSQVLFAISRNLQLEEEIKRGLE